MKIEIFDPRLLDLGVPSTLSSDQLTIEEMENGDKVAFYFDSESSRVLELRIRGNEIFDPFFENVIGRLDMK
jgi:hypothetical protein